MGIWSFIFGTKPKLSSAVGSTVSPQKRYFELLNKIKEHKTCHDYESMLRCCEQTIPLLSGFVEETRREYGK